MTTRTLITPGEVKRHVDMLKKLGLPIGAIDIRADGVTISPPLPDSAAQGSAFDSWLAKDLEQDANRERSASR